jgi:hypothetical protein
MYQAAISLEGYSQCRCDKVIPGAQLITRQEDFALAAESPAF